MGVNAEYGVRIAGPSDAVAPVTFGVLANASGNAFTEHMRIDSAGIVTKPLQPAFQVKLGATSPAIPYNTNTTLLFNSELFDQNHDFNTGTYSFTAPVTGKYSLSAHLLLLNLDSSAHYYQLYIVTSNRLYYDTFDPRGLDQDTQYHTLKSNVLADMDAGDTAYVRIYQQVGTTQTTANVTTCLFSGFLAC